MPSLAVEAVCRMVSVVSKTVLNTCKTVESSSMIRTDEGIGGLLLVTCDAFGISPIGISPPPLANGAPDWLGADCIPPVSPFISDTSGRQNATQTNIRATRD